MGFLFVIRSTAAEEPGTLERLIDMLRRLRREDDVYDWTCLVVGEWLDPPDAIEVKIRHDLVPDDLAADTFIAKLIDGILERTPVDMHVEARERREHRDLGLEEADETFGSDDA